VKHGGVGFIREMPGHPKNSRHLHEEPDTYSQRIKHMPSQSKATLHMLDHPSNRAYGHLTNDKDILDFNEDELEDEDEFKHEYQQKGDKHESDSSPHAMYGQYGHYMRDHLMPSQSLSDIDLHMHAKPISSKYHKSKTIAYKPMFEKRHKQPMAIPHMHKQHRVHKPMYHQFLHSDSTPEQIMYDQSHEEDENEDEEDDEDDKGYLFDSHDGNRNLDDFEDYEIGDHDGHNAELTYPIHGHQSMIHRLMANHARTASKPMHVWKPNTAQKIQRLMSEKLLMQHDRNFAKGYQSLHNGHDHLEDEYDHEDAYDYEDFEEDKEYEVDEYVLPEDDHEVKLAPFEPKNVYQKIPNKDMEHNEQEIDQFKQQLSSLFHPRQILKRTGLQPEEFHLDPAEFSIDRIEHDLEPKVYKAHSPKHHWEIAPRSFFKPVGIQNLGGTKQVFPIGHGQIANHRQQIPVRLLKPVPKRPLKTVHPAVAERRIRSKTLPNIATLGRLSM